MAAQDSELMVFVKEALAKGVAREDIHAALLKAGWAEEEVRDALSSYLESDFPVPVPKPKSYLSARDAFIYLVIFSTLGLSAYHCGHIIFQLIDIVLPDPATRTAPGYFREHSVRWSVAVLIVAFPIYLYLSVTTARAISDDPVKRASKVRRWLTYVTLFLAALVILGDLITLIYQFLIGDLTLSIALKIMTVGVLSGGIFTFYIASIQADEAGGHKS